MPENRNRLFYLIKLFRMEKGFALFDVGAIMRSVKNIQLETINKNCLEEEQRGSGNDFTYRHNTTENITKIEYIIYL